MKVSVLKELISKLEDTDDICCEIHTWEWANEFIEDDEWAEGSLTKESWGKICEEYEQCDFTPDSEWLQDAIMERRKQ